MKSSINTDQIKQLAWLAQHLETNLLALAIELREAGYGPETAHVKNAADEAHNIESRLMLIESALRPKDNSPE